MIESRSYTSANEAFNNCNVIVCSVAQQATERDDWCQNGKVQENKTSKALKRESIRKVRSIVFGFTFNIVNKTAKKSTSVSYFV